MDLCLIRVGLTLGWGCAVLGGPPLYRVLMLGRALCLRAGGPMACPQSWEALSELGHTPWHASYTTPCVLHAASKHGDTKSWRPLINYNVLGTVIGTSGLLNFVLIRALLFLPQQFLPSAAY